MSTQPEELIDNKNAASPANAAGTQTDITERNSYNYDSCEFYCSIISPGELGVVAAVSGGMKTMFLCNLACVLATNDTRVGYINVQMQDASILRRLHCMITDFPYEQCDTTEGLDQLNGLISACKHIDNIKLCTIRELPEIARCVADMARDGYSVVIIDGFDSVENQHTSHLEMNKLIGILPELAKQLNISLWISSQVTSSAEGLETVSLDKLSATRTKAQEAAIVITLGPRIQGQLLTALIVKNRSSNQLPYPACRLILRPSFRLDVMPNPHVERVINEVDTKIYKSERINALPGDFPGDFPDDDVGEDDEDDIGEDDAPFGDGPKPYHGIKGFVPVGRFVFSSAIFMNWNYAQFCWLMDLYASACFEPQSPNAPGTSIPVHINPGQLMTSWSILKNRWGLASNKRVRLFLKRAETEGLITRELVLTDGTRISTKGSTSGHTKKARCTVITLCHYVINKKGAKHDNCDLGSTLG